MIRLDKCEHLDLILEAEKAVIAQNLGELIKDRKIVMDFIEIHGEDMRAEYCGNVCPDRGTCEYARQYDKQNSDC